jgi:hypothetical protein
MPDLYPGYDVLSKRNSPSWNEQTRLVIDQRLRIDPNVHAFFSDTEWLILRALCDRIVPQPVDRPHLIPIAAMVDQKMHENERDGYRHAALPPMREAWRRGLTALDAEALCAHGRRFHELVTGQQDALIKLMQQGQLYHNAWEGMPAKSFFEQRVLNDIVKTYYSRPTAWNEIGWGGPAGQPPRLRSYGLRSPRSLGSGRGKGRTGR